MNHATQYDSILTGQELRRKRGSRTQDSVSAEMGISPQYLSQLEKGQREFTERVMGNVQKAFPDFKPVIRVEGANIHVTNQQNSSEDGAVMMTAAKDTLAQANRTLQIANNLLELAHSMIGKQQG